jgi:Adenylate and Guanylate cyclase catalytic domain
MVPCPRRSPHSIYTKADSRAAWRALALNNCDILGRPEARRPADERASQTCCDSCRRRGGYSRLIGIDEEGTLKRIRKLRRELINPAVALHRGRIVKTTGDGILIEFPSVVDAVRCALEVQRGMDGQNIDVPGDRRLDFRVGINLGDVVVEGEDLLGDGVNVAARMEGISEPGGICISDVADHPPEADIGTAGSSRPASFPS